MCEFGDTVEIAVTRRVRVDRCIAGAVIRLNAMGVHTTGSCCGHARGAPFVYIERNSAHRARSLGLDVDYNVPPGTCLKLMLAGGNSAIIDALPLAGSVSGGTTAEVTS